MTKRWYVFYRDEHGNRLRVINRVSRSQLWTLARTKQNAIEQAKQKITEPDSKWFLYRDVVDSIFVELES